MGAASPSLPPLSGSYVSVIVASSMRGAVRRELSEKAGGDVRRKKTACGRPGGRSRGQGRGVRSGEAALLHPEKLLLVTVVARAGVEGKSTGRGRASARGMRLAGSGDWMRRRGKGGEAPLTTGGGRLTRRGRNSAFPAVRGAAGRGSSVQGRERDRIGRGLWRSGNRSELWRRGGAASVRSALRGHLCGREAPIREQPTATASRGRSVNPRQMAQSQQNNRIMGEENLLSDESETDPSLPLQGEGRAAVAENLRSSRGARQSADHQVPVPGTGRDLGSSRAPAALSIQYPVPVPVPVPGISI